MASSCILYEGVPEIIEFDGFRHTLLYQQRFRNTSCSMMSKETNICADGDFLWKYIEKRLIICYYYLNRWQKTRMFRMDVFDNRRGAWAV